MCLPQWAHAQQLSRNVKADWWTYLQLRTDLSEVCSVVSPCPFISETNTIRRSWSQATWQLWANFPFNSSQSEQWAERRRWS